MPNMFSGKREIYVEVAERYERFIRSGVLKEGDKLPSVRSAAVELGVNPNTVQRAYSLLEEKALIVSLPKKGVFVAESIKASPDNRNAQALKCLAELKERGFTEPELKELLKEVFSND